MDWATGIQNALDYIEENLTNELDYEVIAEKAHVSSYYFQKMFSILCGYPVGEYLRNRKLTLAANDIISVDLNIFEIGMKYGYKTPESFTRAFKRFHGVTPIDARKRSVEIKSCSRLIVKTIVEGGSVMNYKIVEKESFNVIGKGISIDMNSQPEKTIWDFWRECEANGVLETLINISAPDHDITPTRGKISNKQEYKCQLGQIYQEDCKVNQSFPENSNVLIGVADSSTYMAGKYTYYISALYDGVAIPPDYEVRNISAQTWIVFNIYLCQNDTVNTIMNMLRKIFTEFFPTSAYRPNEKLQLDNM